ncbi:MAG TPA: immunoglobulin-like domain-containing protein [Nocardioides sp.]|nr:immunoglobulin-like domain-containing protein [Nocardioides sp.]
MTLHLVTPTRRRAMATAAVIAALAGGSLAATATAARADTVPAPTAVYDMSHSGSTLTDVSGNGHDASLVGLDDGSFLDTADGDVLRFANDGYASLPQGPVTASDNDFTVEMTLETSTATNQFAWVLGDGVGAWNTTALGNYVFMNPDDGESAYAQQILSGIRVKTGSGNGEVRLPAGGGLNPGFTTVTMVSSGNTLTLYRDGVQISTVTHSYAMSSIIPSGDVLGYLGRSLYTGDSLLTADVSGVKLWDSALTAAQVGDSMPSATQRAALSADVLQDDLGAKLLGANPSLNAVTGDLSFPASVDGTSVSWSSSNTAVVSATGAVTRGATDQQVTVTATAGGTAYPFQVTVLARSAAEAKAEAEADLDAVSFTDPTTENLPLDTTGSVNGSAITWTSSDDALVTPTEPGYAAPAVGAADPFAGGGRVTRPAYGAGDATATLTATATLDGQTATKTYDVTVAEQGRTAPDAGYAAAYFKSDSNEKIYEAATTGNDFFSFGAVNGGNAVITSTADTTGLRDPYILRSHNGDKYYMVATDLCIGCGTSWGDSQSKGSLKIEVYSSTDLVHWSRTNSGPGGITVNQPAAGMTWAPEAYWDDSLQSYVVFFSSRLYSDATHSNADNLYARGFYVLTRDFKTFTAPQLWDDTGYARIDSTVIKIGDYYYRFTKNEESGAADGLEAGKDVFLERSKVLTSLTSHSSWTADPATTWQLLDTNMTTPVTGNAGEGPEIIKLNAGDPADAGGDGYVFLVDNYGAGGYRAFTTTGSAITSSTQADRLSKRPGWTATSAGLPSSPRHGAFVSVTQSVLDAMHGWTGIAAVGSTTTATAAGHVVTAKVTAADGGDVAGTVTLTAGLWHTTATLTGGTVKVTVPTSVVGTVTVAYDGYTDHLVTPSSTTVTVAKTASTTTLSLSAKTLRLRRGVATLTVRTTVRVGGVAGIATGQIRVKVGSTSYLVKLVKGLATLHLRLRKPGRYAVTATYLGTATVAGSHSATTHVVVRR